MTKEDLYSPMWGQRESLPFATFPARKGFLQASNRAGLHRRLACSEPPVAKAAIADLGMRARGLTSISPR